MVEGNLITHTKLETGNRARMKILRVDASKDLPKETINSLLQQEGLELYHSGRIKTKHSEPFLSNFHQKG